MKAVLKLYFITLITSSIYSAEEIATKDQSSFSEETPAKNKKLFSKEVIALIARIKKDKRDYPVIQEELSKNPNSMIANESDRQTFRFHDFESKELKTLNEFPELKDCYIKNCLPITAAFLLTQLPIMENPHQVCFRNGDARFFTVENTAIKEWDISLDKCTEKIKTQLKDIAQENQLLISPDGSRVLVVENKKDLYMTETGTNKFIGFTYLTGREIKTCSFITENIACITYTDETSELWDPEKGRCEISQSPLPAEALEASSVVGAFASEKEVIVFKKTMKKKASAKSEELVDELFQKNATPVCTLPTKSPVTKIAFDEKALKVTALTSENKVHAWVLNPDFSQDLKASQEFWLDELSKKITPEGIIELHPDGSRIALETTQGSARNQLICVYQLPTKIHLYNIPYGASKIVKFVFGSTNSRCVTLYQNKKVTVWNTPEKLDFLGLLAKETKQQEELFSLEDLHDFHKRGADAIGDFKFRAKHNDSLQKGFKKI